MARATPHTAQTGEWRERVMTVALRALRAVSSGSLAALTATDGERAEILAIVPCPEEGQLARAARRGRG